MSSRVLSVALSRVTAPGLALLTAFLFPLLLLLPAATAWAGDQPINPAEFPRMQEDLVKGPNALRKGVLDALQNTPNAAHPDVYGEVLGPIFRDTDLTRALSEEQRRALFARLIKHLADEQSVESGQVLLAADFLPLMVADDKLVELLLDDANGLSRDYKTKRRKGWERILARSRDLLTAEKDAVRRAAIRISARCDCQDVADAAAALYKALKAANPLAAADAEAYLAAAESLFRYRFPDAGQLLTFLEPFAPRFADTSKMTLADKYRLRGDLLLGTIGRLTAAGGTRRTSAERAALAYGKLLIEKATTPDDLQAFFDPDMEQYVELQRAALIAARARMKPEANEAWAGLLRAALTQSTDREVLEGVIELLGPTFTRRSDDTHQLATDVALRLQQREKTDDATQRKALAFILGDIGSRGDVDKALPDPIDLFDVRPEQIPVYSVLVRALGRVDDGMVALLVPYYVMAGDRRPPVWQRLAVVKALGDDGIRSQDAQGRLSSLMLRHVLTGDAITADDNLAAGVPADREDDFLLREATNSEDDVEVRAAAIDSLEWYPGPATAAVLGVIAGEQTKAADHALTILGRQLGLGDSDAGLALAAQVKPDTPEALTSAVLEKILAVKDPVKKLSAEALQALSAAARIALEKEKAEALRGRAADTVAHLADADAIKQVRLIWGALPAPGDATKPEEAEARKKAKDLWAKRLLALFVAVAEGGRKDTVLADELGSMADEGFLDEVIAFFEQLGEAAQRPILKFKHADAHFVRGNLTEPPKAEQRQDLERAARLYSELLGVVKDAAVRADLQRSLFGVYTARGAASRIASDEKASDWQLKAYRIASESRSPGLAREALESLSSALKQAKDLNEAQQREVKQLTGKLEKLAGG